MELNTREDGGKTIVEMVGRLDSNTSGAVETSLSAIIEGGASKLVLDFGKLDYISSAGLRIVLVASKKLNAAGGELQLCALNELVQEVFDISGFSSLLNVHKTLEEALSAQ
jgi:anti-anti-sigma factor